MTRRRRFRRNSRSRSGFFAWTAKRRLEALDDEQTTDAINRALGDAPQDTTFTDAAAERLLRKAKNGSSEGG